MIFLANLHGLLLLEAEPALKKANKSRKYDHKINNNIAIGLLKYDVIEFFLNENPKLIWQNLKRKILKHTEAIRPNRKYPRKKSRIRCRGKYKTETNYRIAA